MSASFQYFRRGACPVCNGAAKGCRQSNVTLDIFCRSKQETGLNGWNWVGSDKHGFGIYRDTQQTPAQQQAAAQALADHQRREREKRAGFLPNAERNHYYHRIARHTGLGSASRAELKRRDLSDRQIEFAVEQGWLSDWQQGSCGGLTLNSALAGVHPTTGKLTGVDGLAIYASDVQGNLVGAQVRPISPFVREQRGKYLWLSSSSKGGNGPQLRSGLLPLFIFQHPDFNPALPCQVEAAEGSLKPLIHALRLWDEGQIQTIVIGAASGHFAGLDAVLRQYSCLDSFILHADAGAQDNPDFRRKYPQAIAQVPAGIKTAIGWWGQTDKHQHPDIDELTPSQRANLQQLSVLEWLQLGHVAQDDRRIQQEIKQAAIAKKVILPTDQTAVQRTLERMCRNALELYQAQDVQFRQKTTTHTTSTAIVPWKPPVDPLECLVVTEKTVPTFADWQFKGHPRLHIEGDPVPVLLKLVEMGYESVLLDDRVGSGKSHVAGQFLQTWQEQQAWRPQIEQKRALYYATDYKNPSTPTLEAIPETPTGGALNYDHEHLTPSGKPFRKRAPQQYLNNQSGKTQTPDIPALCEEDANIQATRAKGVDLYRGSNQAICRNCAVGTKNCPYLREMGKIQEESALRSHLSKGGSGSVALVDEAGQQLNNSRTITAKPSDLGGEMIWLHYHRLDLYQDLESIAQRLKQGLDRAVEERGRYGLTHAELLKFLPDRNELEQLYWEAVGDKLLRRGDDPWSWPKLEEVANSLRGTLQPNPDQLFRGQSVTGKAHQIDHEMTPAVLPRFITLVMGHDNHGKNSGKNTDVAIAPTGMVTFTESDPRQQRTLSQFDTVFLMDATPDVRDLAQHLNIEPQQLTRVSWAAPTFENLTLKIVRGIGKASQQRRTDGQYAEQQRIHQLVATLVQHGANQGQVTGLLDLKAHISSYSDLPLIRGHQFAHSRGSNAFKHCEQLMIIAGNARENLGAALAQWHIQTGQAHTLATAPPAFWAWIERRARANLLQANGRTRAQHRPDIPITHYLVGEVSEADIAALQQYFTGCTIQHVHAYDLCPAAASQGYQSERAIAQAMWAATEREETATINQIAQTTGMSKGGVSKRVSTMLETSGYRAFRESFQLLYKALNSARKLSDLPEQLQWIAQEYLPQLAEELQQQHTPVPEIAADILDTISVLGDNAQHALATLDSTTIAALLGALIRALPTEDLHAVQALQSLRSIEKTVAIVENVSIQAQ